MVPTDEQFLAFVEAVNKGREAFGLEPIDKLEFDESEPGSSSNCLSARHLIKPIGRAADASSSVGTVDFYLGRAFGDDERVSHRLAQALDAECPCDGIVRIPDSIRDVTDEFDNLKSRPPAFGPDKSDPEVANWREALDRLGLLA